MHSSLSETSPTPTKAATTAGHQDVRRSTHPPTTLLTRTQPNLPRVVIHPIHIHMPEHTLWSTAAAPPTSSSTAPFALGTSHGLHILRAEGPYWSLSHHSVPYSKHFDLDIDQQLGTDSTHVQVTSVEWLSSEVVAAGLRDSTVFLHDLRSNGCATRLKHPSAVTGIKKVDEWRVVVGGFGSVFLISLSRSNPIPFPDLILTCHCHCH